MKLSACVPERIAKLSDTTSDVEICGLLLADWDSLLVDDFVCSPGPLYSHRFELSPEWILSESLQQRSQGRRVVGYFHSHPTGQGVEPSIHDRAGHPPRSYVLIVSGDRWKAYRTGWELEPWSPWLS